MKTITWFFSNMTLGPFRTLTDLLGLPPERIGRSLGLLATFMIVCELVRVVLGPSCVRSRLAHVVRCLLTFPMQAVALAGVLVYAALRYPERAWINLGFALFLYATWYAAGALTSLARSDNEGADLGFMTVGALITFPVGVAAALLAV